jgi:hypothetical protein
VSKSRFLCSYGAVITQYNFSDHEVRLGFFVYGKKQKAIIPILSGIGLMVFPYFISNLYIMILSGIILVALPYFIRI